MSELTFERVYNAFEASETSMTADEIEQKTAAFCKQHNIALPEELPEFMEIDFDDELSDEENIKLAIEDYSITEQQAAKLIRKAKDERDPFYDKLDEQDRRAVKKLQAAHPDAGWTYEKFYKTLEVNRKRREGR